MNYYRSNMQGGGGSSEYETTYTILVNGEPKKTRCPQGLAGNTTFNDQVIIGNNIYMLDELLDGCTSFNQDITMPSGFSSCFYMLNGCTKFGKNIYFKGNTYRTLDVYGFLSNCNNSLRKNIFFNSVFNSVFNNSTRSLAGYGHTVTWTAMTNGFYNSTYNIYCYYNYSG